MAKMDKNGFLALQFQLEIWSVLVVLTVNEHEQKFHKTHFKTMCFKTKHFHVFRLSWG